MPLSQLKFDLSPEGLDKTIVEPKEINSRVVENMFRHAHYRVFKTWPRQPVGDKWNLVLSNARTSGLPLETFITVIVLSWSITRPHTLFQTVMLTRPMAPDKVMELARICRDTKGYVNADSVGDMFDVNTEGLDAKLLQSEIAYGKYIINWKLYKGVLDFQPIYAELEGFLDPYWLAIEPSYSAHIIQPYLEDSHGSSSLQRNIRTDVMRHIGMLKRNKRIASTVFALRSKIMLKAVNSVLDSRMFKLDDFTHENKPITDSTKFWNVLGLAVLHVECQKAVDCLPHCLWGRDVC